MFKILHSNGTIQLFLLDSGKYCGARQTAGCLLLPFPVGRSALLSVVSPEYSVFSGLDADS